MKNLRLKKTPTPQTMRDGESPLPADVTNDVTFAYVAMRMCVMRCAAAAAAELERQAGEIRRRAAE